MAEILGARSAVNIRLGQVPQTKDPALHSEMQTIYNALHILNQYVVQLSAEIEGTDSNDPAQNLPFLQKFSAPAKQAMTAGDVISPGPGGYYKGVATYGQSSGGGHPANPGTSTREDFSVKALSWAIALTDTAVDELVVVGAGSGVVAVSGTKSGQLVWAKDSRSIYGLVGQTNGTAGPERIVSMPYHGDGLMYLLNPSGIIPVQDIYFGYEGIYLPGFPFRSGDYLHKHRVFFYPIGVCVRDGFVYINDFLADTPPRLGGLLKDL